MCFQKDELLFSQEASGRKSDAGGPTKDREILRRVIRNFERQTIHCQVSSKQM